MLYLCHNINNMKKRAKYQELPKYIVFRNYVLEPISNNQTDFERLIKEAKSNKVRFQRVTIGKNFETWLFVEPLGINRQDLERFALDNIYQYFEHILNKLHQGAIKEANELTAMLSKEQKKCALYTYLESTGINEHQFKLLLIDRI